MKKVSIVLAILGLIAVDQWVKAWVVSHIAVDQLVDFLPGIFSLTHLHNHGAAFSILQNQQGLFVLMTFLVLGGAMWYLWKYQNRNNLVVLSLLLIIAGGLGNFIDRVRLGYVVDMVHLDFMDFAIFNIADSYLSIGVLLLLVAMWKEEKDGSHR